MTRTLRRLLSLTRHAATPGPHCRACLDQQVREELASLAHAQDVDALVTARRN